MNKQVLFGFLLLVLTFSNHSKAQSGLGETITDMVFILDKYVQPASDASVLQTSTGWYYEASSLELYKFNIAANISGLPFPKSKQTFQVNDTDFQNLDIRDANTASIPTALGGNRRVFFDFDIDGNTYEFQAIGGIGTDFFAFPNLQAQVGLWKETELSLRYGPQVKIDRSSYALYGVGVKHNVSQYLFKEDRPIELAVIANYSLVDFNIFFDRLELAAADGSAPIAVLEGYLTDFHAVTFGTIASKQVGNWVYSGGINYNISTLDYSLVGDEGIFLDLFNSSLKVLSEKTYTFKVDAGVAYKFKYIDLYSQLSTDFEFVNLNIGTAYRF